MISKIEEINGSKMIVIDGEPYLPLAYRSFNPMPSNILQFHRSGTKLYQILVSGRTSAGGVIYSPYGGVWVGDHQYDFDPFDKQMRMVKKFAPDAKIMVMIQLDAPYWWLDQHPGSLDTFQYIGEAVFDEEWKKDATDYVIAFLKYAEEKYDNDIFAYAFSGGLCTEWFDHVTPYEPSEKKQKAFKEASGCTEVPTLEDLSDISGICMREPKSKEVLYRDFCGTLTPKLIKYFAKLFKKELNYRKIIGLFYGYANNLSVNWLIYAAIYGYEEVWKDENIDMLFAPAEYSRGDETTRKLWGASGYQNFVDSLEVHNKLYLHEIDHPTHLAQYPYGHGIMSDCYEDLFTTREVLRRELALALCKGGSLWWFDCFGSWFACPELEAEITKQIEIIGTVIKKQRQSVAEIAVFADPKAYPLLKEPLDIIPDLIRHTRDGLYKCGAPCETFNLSDITKIDLSRYKMLVFLYAPRISDEVRKVIEEAEDKLKVYIHLPDVASGDTIDLSAPEKLVKMRLEEHKGNGKAVDNGQVFGFHTEINPIFKVVDEEARILSQFENGDAAAAIKDDNAYIAVGKVPSTLWTALAKYAGVHLYTEKNAPIYTDSRFIACQFPQNRMDQLLLKEDGEYTELFTGKKYQSKDRVLEFEHYNYQMMFFLKNS